MRRLPARAAALGAALALTAIAPATATAASDLVITEHVVPATVSTGETVQARVTVKNVGDAPTEADSEVRWEATGCRRAEFVFNSVRVRKGRQGRNKLTYRLPAGLAPGRYRLTAGAWEAFHRQISRSVRIRVLPPRR